LLSLISAIGYGGSDYAAGLASRRVSVLRVTIIAEGVGVLVMLLVVPWVSSKAPSLVPIGWGAAAGFGGVLGTLALYQGFRHADFSVAGPLSAVASAGFAVLAGLLFGEHPGGLSMAGIALALPAIIGVSASPRAVPEAAGELVPGSQGTLRARASGHHLAGVAWGLAAGAGFGVLFIGLNRAGSSDDLWPAVVAQLTALLAVGVAGLMRGELRPLEARHTWLAVAAGITGAAGTLCYFVATHDGLLAITAVVTSLYPAVTILLARILLGERLTRARLGGLALAVGAVVLIALGGTG
jgi:drug/metabolite transporter (DMT)-like permease